MNCRRKQYSLKDFSEHRECEAVRGEDRNQSLAALRQKEEEESERRFREDKRKTQMPGAADQWEKGFHALLVQGNVFRFVVRVLLFFISAYIAVNLFSLICLIGKSTGIIRWIVIGLVVFLTAGLVYCVVGVLRLFRELPKFQQVSKGTMDEKEQKALLAYIEKLPSTETRWGIGENGSRTVRRVKWCIKQGVEYPKIEKYARDLQKIQIEAAVQVVKECAMQTGLKTAVCPWSTGDVLIVFINTTLMACSIARIFHRRIDKNQAIRLAFKWIGQLYLVGQMQDLADCAAKGIADKVSDILKEVDLAEGCCSVLKPFMGKAAEGAGNAYLVYRLGRCAIREFAILKD